MTDFEGILEVAVKGLAPVKVGGLKNKPVFDFGDNDSLKRTLIAYKEKALPLIWLLPINPVQLEYGLMQEADVVLNICTREVNRDLPNTKRLRKSYELTLYPLWEDLQRQLFLTHQVAIIEETVQLQKFPNFQPVSNDLWDVLQISFTCQFNAKSECLIHN